MSFYRFFLAATLSILGLAAVSAQAQELPVKKVLPLSLATEAAQTALAACEKERQKLGSGVGHGHRLAA